MSTQTQTWEELARAAPNPLWARNGLARLREAGLDLENVAIGARSRLVAVLGASPAVLPWLARDLRLLEVFASPDLWSERSRAAYRESLAPALEAAEPAPFLSRLRQERQKELLRIVAREVLAIAPVEVTAREVSAFAEAAVETAMTWAMASLSERHGAPVGEDGEPNRACALGMGKLGGEELNLSSDVDLVFLYRTPRGRTTGGPGGTLAPAAFYASFVTLVADALSRLTGEGLVFRVDLDLRPEGRSGELAQAVDNALLYYQSWGQTWERAVLLKARPVAGDLPLGRKFLEEVRPFVFRRSLDYTTIEDFKEMKDKIDRNAARRLGGDDDLKLGRGGIREVEFFVQTLQLIHGGKIPEVRERNTWKALDRLREAGLTDESTARGLQRCYRFLRSLEHGVQAIHFRQTHRLPQAPEERGALGRRLGLDGTEKLMEELDDVRAEVHEAYGRLFHGASKAWEGEDASLRQAQALLHLEVGDSGAEQRLHAAGFREAAAALEGLRLLREGPPKAHPSPRARRILNRVAPLLLTEVARSPHPDRALLHLGEFLAASGARASYLSLLEENPSTARLLLNLFGTSGFLSRYLVAHPELIDELVLNTSAVRVKGREELDRELEAAMALCGEEEDRLDTLRRFRNAEFLRVALNDLAGALEPEAVGEQLSRVADVCLEAALRQAFERLAEKYGAPADHGGRPGRFAVLGLGKLGGQEIDYHSDLDILFIYSGPGSTARAGSQGGLASSEFFARLAQRILGVLGSRTREGIAFRMDARLRPSGQAGPLVTTLEAFESYHQEGSQLWEKLALVKLRAVAGDAELGSAAVRLARAVLYAGPPAEDPRPEIRRMRARIEAEVGREDGTRIDLKTGRGGIVDVEFAVQALQLMHGWTSEEIQSPRTLEALAALRGRGYLADEEGRCLAEGYAFLRRVEARLRILLDRATDALPPDAARLGELARGLGYEGAGDGAGRALLEELTRHREGIRTAFAQIIGEG